MKLICAPMATISHPAFRIMIEKFGGCDEYYNEMINAPSLLNMGPFEKYYIVPAPEPEKMVWQLTGKDVSSMVRASEIVAALPGLSVDLNMGCCAPEIVRSGAGIAWMLKERSLTEELVREVSAVVKNPSFHKKLSVKLRLGDDDFTDEGFFSFCDMLVKNGVERLALHPRTKKEKYRDKPRYAYVQALCDRYKNHNVQIVLNGDISDKESLEKALAVCPDCYGVMIGRAAVQKPWIFRLLSECINGRKYFEDQDFTSQSQRNISSDGESSDISINLPDSLSLALDYIDDV
ncbi:MAG: tRNA-dihydrouridine synthase family protein, partial [Treponema sp.]|nr:tRNA-dihydrouridine synthase family protein [Treponema sp.]